MTADGNGEGKMAFKSLSDIEKYCADNNVRYGRAVMLEDMRESGRSGEETLKRMEETWSAMEEALDDYDRLRRSQSGLSGGDGGKMQDYVNQGGCMSGTLMGNIIAAAIKMGESNACMRRIVAAPTAGASGVLPAVLVCCAREYGSGTDEINEALFTAAGIGQVIAERAYISGAMGGCQAEVGAASAMAAGALVALREGSPAMINYAAAMSLQNLLGLVCDPVGGLVEIPCVKRNVIGAVSAMAAADMALAGIVNKINPDDVIDAMREVGDRMDPAFKETGEGGLAATVSGRKLAEKLNLELK